MLMYHRSRKRLKASSYKASCLWSELLHSACVLGRRQAGEAAIAWLGLLSNNSSFLLCVCVPAVAVVLFPERSHLSLRTKFLSDTVGRYAT